MNKNKRTRSSNGLTKSVSFRVTPEEFEAIRLLSAIDGAKGSATAARIATLEALYKRVPQYALDRLGLQVKEIS